MTGLQNQNCRLCLEDKPLCRSHIISEFNYRPMYDDEHRFRILSSEPRKKTQFKRKGLRERLLCRDCESLISKWEQYVRNILYGGTGFYGRDDGAYHYVSGLDYGRVRLYYLSILWRMSISTLDMYKEVSLGPHEETIREMLLASDPGKPDQYGVVCIAPVIDGQMFDDWILQPTYAIVQSHRVYRIVIGGLLYLFFVSSHSVPRELKDAFVSETGDWVIVTRDVRKIPFINQWFNEVSKSLKG